MIEIKQIVKILEILNFEIKIEIGAKIKNF